MCHTGNHKNDRRRRGAAAASYCLTNGQANLVEHWSLINGSLDGLQWHEARNAGEADKCNDHTVQMSSGGPVPGRVFGLKVDSAQMRTTKTSSLYAPFGPIMMHVFAHFCQAVLGHICTDMLVSDAILRQGVTATNKALDAIEKLTYTGCHFPAEKLSIQSYFKPEVYEEFEKSQANGDVRVLSPNIVAQVDHLMYVIAQHGTIATVFTAHSFAKRDEERVQ